MYCMFKVRYSKMDVSAVCLLSIILVNMEGHWNTDLSQSGSTLALQQKAFMNAFHVCGYVITGKKQNVPLSMDDLCLSGPTYPSQSRLDVNVSTIILVTPQHCCASSFCYH